MLALEVHVPFYTVSKHARKSLNFLPPLYKLIHRNMLDKLPLDHKQYSLLGNNLIQILNLKQLVVKIPKELP
jgi:hypothetical protein